ncbi:MAG: hypothetical protein JXX29_18945 [Deltaproteobacteria bacterium]|nr:hypothetical protein [Deltaproteobacteria bacterium]MBN2673764.1 hypothetical protein [Deltaproteobacteria bacterium]
MKKLILLSCLLLTVLPAPSLQAKETPSDEEVMKYVTMPEEYEEKQKEIAKQEQAAKGDVKENPGYVPGYRATPGIGLSPAAPTFTNTAAGAAAPAFGSRTKSREPKFEFHGYIQPCLRMGSGESPSDGKTTLHGDPVVAGGSFGWFDHTNTVPTPWAQINFSYGNEVVKATAMIGAWSTTEGDEAGGTYMGNAQQLFTDVFLTYTPDLAPISLKINAGVFPDRYGFMSKYHQGAYGTSLVGDIHGAGITGTLELPFVGDWEVIFEGGFKGEFAKADMPLQGANEHAQSMQGSTFAGHGHMAVHFAKYFTPAVHFIYSFSNDDRKDLQDRPDTPQNETQERKDGSLRILAGDLRIDMRQFGYLYTGLSNVKGENTNSLTDLVKVLNTGSGKDFNEHFWGYASNGNGTLTLFGLQYGISLGTLLRAPVHFDGVGPDLTVNVFTILGHTKSDADDFDNKNMMKYGTELFYSFSEFVAGAFRFDHVMPDFEDKYESFEVFSPKLILRSGWKARESLVLQYSYYNTAKHVEVQGDNRLVSTNSTNPDHHMVAVYGTIWW